MTLQQLIVLQELRSLKAVTLVKVIIYNQVEALIWNKKTSKRESRLLVLLRCYLTGLHQITCLAVRMTMLLLTTSLTLAASTGRTFREVVCEIRNHIAHTTTRNLDTTHGI